VPTLAATYDAQSGWVAAARRFASAKASCSWRKTGTACSGETRVSSCAFEHRLSQSDPHLGGAVNFSVTYPREVKSPRIAVRCYGYDGAGYAEAGPYDAWFVLGGASSDWQRAGGDAQCIADLFYFTWKPNRPQEYHWLASSGFEARG